MALLGTLSNLESQERLRRLVEKLERVGMASGSTPAPRTLRKRERGRVLKTVIQVLADAGRPMQVSEIRAGVEALRGEPVPASSVKDCLASNAGPGGRFIRIARGRYQITVA